MGISPASCSYRFAIQSNLRFDCTLFMSKTLIIAEKPSVARDLARVLGKFRHEKDFYENDRYVISSAVGHVVEMVPPEGAEVKRGKWKLENLPVLPDHFDPVPKVTGLSASTPPGP